MTDWVRPLLSMFYAPLRGMAEVRERAPLVQAALLAYLLQSAYTLYAVWPTLSARSMRGSTPGLLAVLRDALFSLLFTAMVFVPVTILVANIFERRASFGLAVQQDFAAIASTVLYARAAATLVAFPVLVLSRLSGFERVTIAQTVESLKIIAEQQNLSPVELAMAVDPQNLLKQFALFILLPLLALWLFLALRESFRFSWPRTALLLALSIVIMFPLAVVLGQISNWIFASPFLLVMLFFLVRGYLGEVTRQQRARVAFRQNLEASTLNPADASAHYNLGLLHLQRKELDKARERFERAVEIDAGEIDAHYQLGRIARAQGQAAAAIRHFEQVVERDQTHAQHEIWREVGATYLLAEQFTDARDALERFLEHRQADPEGLYLMGRALAGMGRRREAKELMQACIEAVKTSPAYKYRAEKRWLNEAQQFLRSQA